MPLTRTMSNARLSEKLVDDLTSHNEEPNSPTTPPTDESDNDSSDSDGESPETKDLKQSIRQQLCKQSVVQPLLLSLCNGILTNPDVFNAVVDAVYKAMNLDDIKQDVYKSVSMDISTTNAKVTSLQTKIDNLEAEKSKLADEIDDLEQYSRRNCLLIHGIPESNKEDTTAACLENINKKLKVNLTRDHLDRTHRVGKRKSSESDDAKPRPIIMKFISYTQRQAVFRTKKNLKGSNLLITESLTTKRMAVLRAAQNKVRAEGIKRAWTQDGRIIILTNDEDKVTIKKISDLDTV